MITRDIKVKDARAILVGLEEMNEDTIAKLEREILQVFWAEPKRDMLTYTIDDLWRIIGEALFNITHVWDFDGEAEWGYNLQVRLENYINNEMAI